LIFIDDKTEGLVADLNLLFGGLDRNFSDDQLRDPWGARPVAACLPGSEELPDYSFKVFGRYLDFVIDLDSSLSSEIPAQIFGDQLLCIQPLDQRALWTSGWPEDSQSKENAVPKISVFLQSSIEASELIGRCFKSQKCWILKTEDMILTLLYIIHSGRVVKRSELEVMNEECFKGGIKGTCKITISPFHASVSEKPENQSTQKSEKSASALESQDSRTFDAVLRKSKDYPIDWWQGGSEHLLSMDDLNYQALTKAAVNFTVRWLVVGYLVIGIAVPRAFGWDAV